MWTSLKEGLFYDREHRAFPRALGASDAVLCPCPTKLLLQVASLLLELVGCVASVQPPGRMLTL